MEEINNFGKQNTLITVTPASTQPQFYPHNINLNVKKILNKSKQLDTIISI